MLLAVLVMTAYIVDSKIEIEMRLASTLLIPQGGNLKVLLLLYSKLWSLLLISAIKQTQENITNIKITSTNKHPLQYLVK